MTDQQVNTTDIDYGTPSLRAIANAVNIDTTRLPDYWDITDIDNSDCLRPGATSGEIICTGYGPDEVIDEWDDEEGHHEETDASEWGFRIRIDQIGGDS